MRAVTPDQTWTHIFPEDLLLPPEERTTYHLYTLDAATEAYLEDRLGAMNDEGYSVKLGTQDLLALDVGMAKVENLLGDAGPIEIKRDETAKQIEVGKKKFRPWLRGFENGISAIPKDKRKALAQLILRGPKPTEAEAKN